MSSVSLGGSLVHRAANRLQSGPVHTLDLARHILGLSGHPGAAAKAIFTLLGRDARFVVDGEGAWSLLDQSRLPGPALNDVAFAVVDVETTGGSSAQGHRIMDVAVVEVRNGAVVDEWRTLVNPGRAVAPFVEALTGIRTHMLRAAPYFDHVAPELQSRLEGRVFVAHNAAFDWRFVSSELNQALGEVPDVTRLCTVKMVRALLPSLRRRNLDAVSAHFGGAHPGASPRLRRCARHCPRADPPPGRSWGAGDRGLGSSRGSAAPSASQTARHARCSSASAPSTA